MVNVVQAVLSLLSLSSSKPASENPPWLAPSQNKSIAIIGAGSAGLAALQALLDLPLETRQSWSIVLFEQRRDVGGIWLPDPIPPHPPVLPGSPLYPRLRTNIPHPAMTYPGFLFPPMTPVFPSHEYVLAYHQAYAEKFGLKQYIRFNTTVLEAAWRGDDTKGVWNVRTRDAEGNLQDGTETHRFDHLVVASGHNRFPAVPNFPGSKRWLDNTLPGRPKRSILHSAYFRDPEDYINRTVMIVGGGTSGRDVARQIDPLTKTYFSLKEINTLPSWINDTTAILKPRISHFTRDGPVFVDNTTVTDIDSFVLTTGYELRIPFLDAGGALRTDPSARSNVSTDGYTGLTTNLRYLYPLHEMVFSLSSKFPTTALSFVGLPTLMSSASCPSDRAQGLFIAHAIANSSLLPSRDVLLADLHRHEQELQADGIDPYRLGYRLNEIGASEDYQDKLMRALKEGGAVPKDGRKYVEQWRRDMGPHYALLRRAWLRIEGQGAAEQHRWLDGVTTEEQWGDLLRRMVHWQTVHEKRQSAL